MKNKKLPFIILLFVLVSALSGCAKFELVYEFKEDGTIHEKHHLEIEDDDQYPIQESALKGYVEARKLKISKQRKYSDAFTFIAEKDYQGNDLNNTLAQLAQGLQYGEYSPFTSATITRSSSYSQGFYDLNFIIDFTEIENMLPFRRYGVPDPEFDKVMKGIHDIEFTIALIVPFKVEESNADSIEELDGAKKYTWQIKSKKVNEIKLTFTKENKENIQKYNELKEETKNFGMITLGIGAIVFMFAIILLLLMRKKKGGKD